MIIAAVAEAGGRFVEETMGPKKTIVYRPVCHEIITRKVSQALREKHRPRYKANEANSIALARLPITRIEAPLNTADLRATPAAALATQAAQHTSPVKPSATTRKIANEDSLARQHLETRSSPPNSISSMVRRNPRLPTGALTFGPHYPMDVLDLVSMPLVPSPDAMWSMPPLVTEADLAPESLEPKDAFMCGKASHATGGAPNMSVQYRNRKFPTSNRLDSFQSDSQVGEIPPSWVPNIGCMPPSVCRAFDLVPNDCPLQDSPFAGTKVQLHVNNPTWKNMTYPGDIRPPTSHHARYIHESPYSSLPKDEWLMVVDGQGSQDTTSTSPSFHSIRPKMILITDIGPRHSVAVAETTTPEFDQGTTSVCTSERRRSEDAENGGTSILQVSLEHVSIRERSPDPMAMFASALSSDDQTKSTSDSYLSKGNATWQAFSSRSAFAQYRPVLWREKGASSPLLSSARLSSGTIPSSRLTMNKRDVAFNDAVRKEARASRILEFGSPSFFSSKATKTLKSNEDEATDYAPLREQRSISSATSYSGDNGAHGTEPKSRIRRVSDVMERLSKEDIEPEQATIHNTLALSCPTRRVSL